MEFGRMLRSKRKIKGYSQSLLAKKAGMTSVQLCKIEKSKSSPTLETIERLAQALNLSLVELLIQAEDKLPLEKVEEIDINNRDISRYISTRYKKEENRHDEKILERIVTAENNIIKLESKLQLPHSSMVPLVHSLSFDEFGAHTVARFVRSACAVGAASFSDLGELLEFRNIRIHIMELPKEMQSRSYYDKENKLISIVLTRATTPERHIYRLAYELAWAVMFGSIGFRQVRYSAVRHRFAREFTSEFLMPEESVRFTVAQLGIMPSEWTMQVVSWLKSKFNVSAESFALRLEALGLISKSLREKIREQLKEYYKANPNAMEPPPSHPKLKVGLRQKILEAISEKREDKKE